MDRIVFDANATIIDPIPTPRAVAATIGAIAADVHTSLHPVSFVGSSHAWGRAPNGMSVSARRRGR